MKRILLLLSFVSVAAGKAGMPLMTVYHSKEFGGHTQYWAIEQDDRGVMYIGDGYGIQEFDGSSWRLISNANHSFCRSLAKDADGRIYAGSTDMLGYLEADDQGEMRYHSLIEMIQPKDRIFNYVWSVHATHAGIYFQTQERIFRFRQSTSNGAEKWQVDVWQPQRLFGYSFWIDQTLYVQQIGIGLMKMVNDSLILLAGGEQFADDRIHIMLPFPNKSGNCLVATFGRGLFLWDGNSFRPFQTEADDLLRTGMPYAGVITPDSCFALGTLSSGLLVIDRDGRTKHHFTQASGFISNTVSCLFVDRQKNLWAGMDGGVAVLEYHSPVSEFSVPGGTGPSDFCRHQGLLYTAANDGVYYLDEAVGRLRAVSGVVGNSQSYSFQKINDELFVTVSQGIYRIQGKTALSALATDVLSRPILKLCPLTLGTNLIVGGSTDGAVLLRYNPRDPHRLDQIGHVAGTREYVRTAIESEPGVVWIGTMDAGIIRLTFRADQLMHPLVEKFGVAQGLPAGGVTAFQPDKNLLFLTKRGVYRFDPANKSFTPDPFFNEIGLGRNPDEGIIAKDRDGNLWINLGKESAVYKKLADGGYRIEKSHLARFADEVINIICPDEHGVVWFGTANNIIRVAPGQQDTMRSAFPAIIRRVALAGDSVVYHGAVTPASRLNDPTARSFAARFNALRFDFSASSYLNPRANEFRSLLEGFDTGWSTWRREGWRYYTNLPAGKYRFRVQARNIFQQTSSEDVYAFTIQPPWYASWWAWGLYVLGISGLIFGVVRLRTRHLQEKSAALEEVVRERTAEIKSAQEKLVTQSKLAALGAITAGIAHEIKNPLNFVNNFAVLMADLVNDLREVLATAADKMEPGEKTEAKEILTTLQQNAAKIIEHGNRADSIVKSMLQHSRGQSDERQLTDINAVLADDINLAYHGMRAQDSSFNIKIVTDFDPAVGKLDIVPQDVSRVFLNIISNGCYEANRKKQEQNGDFSPTLTVTTRDLGRQVEIRIRDNGYGMPAAVREKLFTPFFTTKPPGKGTGLGLSISYDVIVHQHGGQLFFESEEGQFAEFIIRLPR